MKKFRKIFVFFKFHFHNTKYDFTKYNFTKYDFTKNDFSKYVFTKYDDQFWSESNTDLLELTEEEVEQR